MPPSPKNACKMPNFGFLKWARIVVDVVNIIVTPAPIRKNESRTISKLLKKVKKNKANKMKV